MASSHHAVETCGLTCRHGRKLALDALDLVLPVGGVHAIVGANGAGKSTLFRILLGITAATAGSASVLGRDCARLTADDRGRVGFVNEEHTLPPWMTVAAVIAMQRAHYAARWDERRRRFLWRRCGMPLRPMPARTSG